MFKNGRRLIAPPGVRFQDTPLPPGVRFLLRDYYEANNNLLAPPGVKHFRTPAMDLKCRKRPYRPSWCPIFGVRFLASITATNQGQINRTIITSIARSPY